MPRVTKGQLDNVKKEATKKIKRRKIVISRNRIIAFLICCAVLGLSFIFVKPLERFINFSTHAINEEAVVSDNDLKIHYIDVGQGDSIFIELPDNKTMLIDAGPTSSSTKLINYIDHMILTDTDVIDYFVMTHSDEDHIGGATKVLERYTVKSIYRPYEYSKSESAPSGSYVIKSNVYDRTIKAVDNETDDIVFFKAGMIIDGENYNFMFYGPIEEKYSAPNDFSPIMILTYTVNDITKKFMFTGDAGSEVGEQEIIDTYFDNYEVLDVDVLKVGHHGSKYSSSADFLAIVKAEFAVISCGKDNSYGHPHSEVLSRLDGSTILRTDENGSIMFFVTGSGDMNYVVDTYVPNSYYIKWWYVVSALGVVVVAVCFYGKKSDIKKATTISITSSSSNKTIKTNKTISSKTNKK